MNDEELYQRYGAIIRKYARGQVVQPPDDLSTDVLIGHITGFLPHTGGFRDQSEDFQRLTILLLREVHAERLKSGPEYRLGALDA